MTENQEIKGSKLSLPLSVDHPLTKWSNQISGFYGHPIYLVGSQITGSDSPRDVDIICPIPNKEFELRYGDINEWLTEGGTGIWTDIRWKWANDCTKRSLDGMRCTDLKIDFKVQPMAAFNGYQHIHKEFPPVRLDTRGEIKKLQPKYKPEYILCAATWFDDGKHYDHQPKNISTGVVMGGYRHGAIFAQTKMLTRERKELLDMQKETQGFLTSKNRFVEREEAAQIAYKNDQTDTELKTLHSEDLYTQNEN